MITNNIENIDVNFFIDHAQTGDLILCHEKKWWLSRLIEYFSYSKYSHIGIILRGEDINIDSKIKKERRDPNDLYFIESSYDRGDDVFTGKREIGVECVGLTQYLDQYKSGELGDLYYRKLDMSRDTKFFNIFSTVFYEVRNKPYDLHLWDWIKAKFDIETGDIQRHDTFWCSALVSYFYVQWGILDKNLPWTIIAPRRFSHYENQELSFRFSIEPEKIIDFRKTQS